MKKILMMISVMMLVLTLSGCFGSEEVDDALAVFCEDNPDALVCTNPEATRNEIVANMFNTMMIEFIEGTNDNFCDDYFSATNNELLNACKTDRFSLVPEDIVYLSDDVVITSGTGTNQFIVTTTYEDGSNGFIFTVSIVEEDGVIRFSEFSYEMDIDDSVVNLSLTDDAVKEFMVRVINYDDQGDNYCSLLFTGNAYEECISTSIDEFIPSIYAIYNPVVSELRTNEFSYHVESSDGLEIYLYQLTFTLVDEVLHLSEISYQDLSTYNSIENAEAVLQAFLNDFRSGDSLDDLCDERVGGTTNILECKTTFGKVVDNDSEITSFIESSAGVYHATVEFVGVATTTFEFELHIIIGENGMYDMALELLSEEVSDPIKVYTIEETNEMFTAYFSDYNLHVTYDNETFCSMYVEGDTYNTCITERTNSQAEGAYYQIYIVSQVIGETNRWDVSVRAYFKDKTMEYTYAVTVYENEEGNIGFSYSGRAEQDITDSLDCLNDRIAERYDDYLSDYLNPGIINSTFFLEYINEGYSETVFNEMRNTYRATISSISISSITIGELKDGYYLVQIDGLVDFTDPGLTDYVISQTGRVYLVHSKIMLFTIDMESSSGADAFTVSEIEAAAFVMDAYNSYYTGAINCNYFFDYSNPLVTSCETAQIPFFGEEIVVSATAVATGDNHFTVTRYYEDEYGVLQPLPELFVVVNSYEGTLNFDAWYTNEVLTEEVVDSVVDEYMVMLLDSTVTNTSYCLEYGIDEDCNAVRTALLNSVPAPTYTHETVMIDGEEVEQVTIVYTVDGVLETLTYNVDFELNETGEYEVGDIEDALTNEVMTLSEVTSLIDQFVIDYNNQAMTNEQLADKYFSLTFIDSVFFSERTTYFTESGVMVKYSVEVVSGELSYRFTYTVGTDEFINTFNVYKIVDGVYNLEFLDYVPALPVVPELPEAQAIITQYFLDLKDETMTDQEICDLYYDAAVDCVTDRTSLVDNYEIILSTVYENTTGEVDHFTVVYFLNSFMENSVVTWDITLVVNPDGTAIIEELNLVSAMTQTYLQPNDPPFVVNEVNDLLRNYFDDYHNILLTNQYVCGLYASHDYAYPGATDTDYEMCLTERSIELSTLQSYQLISIIYDYSMYDFYNEQYAHTFYTIFQGVTPNSQNGEELLTIRYLWIVEDENAPLGYYVTSYSNNDYIFGHMNTAIYEAKANEILDIYLDESLSTASVCSDFGAIIPGNNCLVDRATNIGINTYVSHYLTYTKGYVDETIVEINLTFITDAGETMIVTLPMVIVEDVNSSMTAFEIVDYYYYLVPTNLITEEEYNTLVNDFFDDYINYSVTEQHIIDTYFMPSQYYLDRSTDMTDYNNHVIVETGVSHLAPYGSMYYVIMRGGEEGSYTYNNYMFGVATDSYGNYYLEIEYTLGIIND